MPVLKHAEMCTVESLLLYSRKNVCGPMHLAVLGLVELGLAKTSRMQLCAAFVAKKHTV